MEKENNNKYMCRICRCGFSQWLLMNDFRFILTGFVIVGINFLIYIHHTSSIGMLLFTIFTIIYLSFKLHRCTCLLLISYIAFLGISFFCPIDINLYDHPEFDSPTIVETKAPFNKCKYTIFW